MKDREEAEERREKLRKIFKKYKFVLLVLCVGVALLLWPAKGEKSDSNGRTAGQENGMLQIDVSALEKDMERTLSQINGAGKVSAVLTLQSGSRRILAKNVRAAEGETDEETVVVSAGSGGQDALLVQEIYPQFRGALIVCTGGDDPGVQLQILQAVSALTGLSSDRISICAGAK